MSQTRRQTIVTLAQMHSWLEMWQSGCDAADGLQGMLILLARPTTIVRVLLSKLGCCAMMA